MLNKKITTKRSTFLILSMCCTVSSIRIIIDTETVAVWNTCIQPATALIICRKLSLLHMTTMPAIVLTGIGIFVAPMILAIIDNKSLTIDSNDLDFSLILLFINIIICALFALITYLTTFDFTLVLPVINIISFLLLWCRNAIDEIHEMGTIFIAFLLFIIAFNYIGFYIGQLIW